MLSLIVLLSSSIVLLKNSCHRSPWVERLVEIFVVDILTCMLIIVTTEKNVVNIIH